MPKAQRRRMVRIDVAVSQKSLVKFTPLHSLVWRFTEQVAKVRQTIDTRGIKYGARFENAGRFGDGALPLGKLTQMIQRSEKQHSVECGVRQRGDVRGRKQIGAQDVPGVPCFPQVRYGGLQKACAYIDQMNSATT